MKHTHTLVDQKSAKSSIARSSLKFHQTPLNIEGKDRAAVVCERPSDDEENEREREAM